jgi:hypothetical protein
MDVPSNNTEKCKENQVPDDVPAKKGLSPFTLKEQKEIGSFNVPAGARGQRRASRNHKAVVFPWVEAGPQAFRLSLRKPIHFADKKCDPDRCFRKSRRHPRARSKFPLKGKCQKGKEGRRKKALTSCGNLIIVWFEEGHEGRQNTKGS